jgi:ATP-dependent Clp protease ATP-binding subunit ClpB
MTSNLGSDIIREKMEKWKNKMPEHEEELLYNEIMLLLRKSFRPEFLNRVDEIVMFKTLSIDQIREIVKIQLKSVDRMLEENNLKMVVTDEALEWLTSRGYDPQMGARPVKRLIQKEIINELSKQIISGISSGDTVVISTEDGHLSFRTKTRDK